MRHRSSLWASIVTIIALPIAVASSFAFRKYAYQVPFVQDILSLPYWQNGGFKMMGYIWLGITLTMFVLMGLVIWDFFRKKEDKPSLEEKVLQEMRQSISDNNRSVEQLLRGIKRLLQNKDLHNK